MTVCFKQRDLLYNGLVVLVMMRDSTGLWYGVDKLAVCSILYTQQSNHLQPSCRRLRHP